MSDSIAFDKQLTDLAFSLEGEQRQLVLAAASRLRQWREWHSRIEKPLGLL